MSHTTVSIVSLHGTHIHTHKQPRKSFIDAQDELSVTQFMRKYGMPERINEEVFIAMAKALDFIDPDKLSMTVVLTAMNRFLNESNGLQMAFLDGNQPDRWCTPTLRRIVGKNRTEPSGPTPGGSASSSPIYGRRSSLNKGR